MSPSRRNRLGLVRPITTYYKVPSPLLRYGRLLLSPRKKIASGGSDTPLSNLSTPPKTPFYNFVPDQSDVDVRDARDVVWFTSTAAAAATADISSLMMASAKDSRPQGVSEGGGDGRSDIRAKSDQTHRVSNLHGSSPVNNGASNAAAVVGHPTIIAADAQLHSTMTPSAALATPAGNAAHEDCMPPASTLASTRENPLYDDQDASLVPRSPVSTAMRLFGFRFQRKGGSPKPQQGMTGSRAAPCDWKQEQIQSGASGEHH